MSKNGTLVITGASRGIGAATARMAASRGWDVAVNYAGSNEAAKAVAADVVAAGSRAAVIQADVAGEADIVSLFDQAESELGPVRGLVNNAGVLGTQSRLADMDSERIARVIAINTTGVLLCAREAVRRMSTRLGGQGGGIVNVSSMAARLGSPSEYVDYAASKGAVDAMTIGLSKEVADEGIRVNAIRPGLIYTDIHASGGMPDRVDQLKDAVPMKRGGTADEVAETILWLLSDASSYVTGAFIDVSGGR